LGFRFNANFRLEVNQIGEAVTLGDITLEAGRYWRVAAQGQMLLGPVTLVGRFLASAGVASITLTADAEVALDLGESVKLLRFRVGGGFQVSLLGLAGAINLQLLDDVPGSLGFTLTGTYQLQVNTTGRQEEIGGVIAEILLEVGEACQAQQPVIRMVDARQCYFTANLEAQAGTDLRVGQPVSLELEVGSAVVALKGAIRYVAPIVDPGSGLLKVKAVFENRDGRVRPGVTGRMRVD
jgi:multidrug efflux pump subunit AcrA (membrane-fusion protein)